MNKMVLILFSIIIFSCANKTEKTVINENEITDTKGSMEYEKYASYNFSEFEIVNMVETNIDEEKISAARVTIYRDIENNNFIFNSNFPWDIVSRFENFKEVLWRQHNGNKGLGIFNDYKYYFGRGVLLFEYEINGFLDGKYNCLHYIIVFKEDNIKINTVNPFSLNIFENIGDTIDYYYDKDNFTITDNTPHENYREKEDPDDEMIANSSELIIHYKKYGEKIFREIEVVKVTNDSVLGKYIGLSKSKIVETFGKENTPWPGSPNCLQYVNGIRNFNLFINFYFDKDDEDKAIKKIIFGDFL